MKANLKLDMDKIAKGLGAERRGRIYASGGHFGAMLLVAEVQARFRSPSSGGRSTDPHWTEKRLVPLSSKTLDRLENLSRVMSKNGVAVAPLQVAALLLERVLDEVETGTVPSATVPLGRK